jgi:cell division protein FtsB
MREPSSPVWLLPFGLLVFTIVAVPLHILDSQGLPRYRALRSELQRLRDDNENSRREVERLGHEVDHLRSDPLAVERIARDELGMVRKDELIFQFAQ